MANNKRPGCCLYWSFLIHFAAFASLLVGYCTPNWTLVKMSTGEVRLLGLVVTCDREKCETLHVTSARMVFVVIFGMCTFCILLSMFAIQIFCLALCNRSCKEKNIGTCLSYFSLFIAFSIGGTLGLYEIDLKEEAKPDVMAMWMGWSRYCIMGAAGGFFLGAWLNAADSCLRNRSRNRELLKRTADIKAKMALHSSSVAQTQNRNGGNVNINSLRSGDRKPSLAERRMQYANRDKWRLPVEQSRQNQRPKMYNTVECAVRNASKRDANVNQGRNMQKNRLPNSTAAENSTTSGGGNQNIDKRLVQMAKEHRVKSINVKEAPRVNVTTGTAGGRKPRTVSTTEKSSSNDIKKSEKREEKPEFEFCEAALKYRLEKLHQLTMPAASTNEEKRKLSAVQEEDKRSQPRENSVMPKEKKVLTRQETKTLVGHSLLQSSTSMSVDICGNVDNKQNKDERDNIQVKKQLSVDSKTSKTKDADTCNSVSPKTNENIVLRHNKPPPLQRDGQISSLENSFGSNIKLPQTKKTSGSLDSNSNRISRDDVIPPIKRDWKTTECDSKKNNTISNAMLTKTDSRMSEINKAVTASNSKHSGESADGQKPSIPSQDSINTSEMSEEQIKRRQIVESILMAKKDRKKKRITQ